MKDEDYNKASNIEKNVIKTLHAAFPRHQIIRNQIVTYMKNFTGFDLFVLQHCSKQIATPFRLSIFTAHI